MCKEVSVNIDGEETRIIFVDHQHGEMSVCFYPFKRNFTNSEHFPSQVENQMSTYSPDAYLVVYAVDDEPSLDQADR